MAKETRWFFEHGGSVFGPYTKSQLQALAERDGVLESDPVWQEGESPLTAASARTIVAFPSHAHASALPDWLSEVDTAELHIAPLISPPSSNLESPEWLEDLRLLVGLEVFVRAKDPAPTGEIALADPGQSSGLPDWMDGWVTSAPKKEKPIAKAKSVPLAAPVPPQSKSPQAVPIAPVVKAPPAEKREKTPAEKMREESGFDAETGQILDAAKFRRWQQQSRSSAPVSNASFLEVFRKGRLAIEAWIDDDANRLRVLHAELDELRNTPAIQAILDEAGKFGKDLQDKLLHHLAFMVENRRRYYQAMSKRGG